MKALLFAALFLFSFKLLNGQIPFAPVGAKYWLLGICDQNYSHSYAHEITRDTFIQGKYCTYIDTNLGAGIGFSTICDDGGYPVFNENMVHSNGYEVYIYDEINEEFHLLYDFSKTIGDFYKIKVCEEFYYTDSIRIEIKEVENLVFNGVPIVRQLLRGTPVNNSTAFWNYFETNVYEGIGGDRGNILLVPDLFTSIHCITNLLCYWSPATEEVIIGNVSSPYIFVDAFDIPNDNYFKVYPNPNFGDIYLQYDFPLELKSVEVMIYNSMGQLQYFSRLDERFGRKEINSLPVGIYFLSVINEGQVIGSEKIVVIK